MVELSSILNAGVLPRLGMEPSTNGGFRAWVTSASYVPKSISSAAEVLLDRVQLASLVPAIAFDFERFSLAAKESYSVASAEQRSVHALGWPALKYYYASFFAAHAVLRSRGASISKLERRQIAHINSVMKIYDATAPALSPGMYWIAISDDPKSTPGEVTLSIKPYSNRGSGVHEAFWRDFCTFLDEEAARAVRMGLPDASEFVAKSADLSDALLKGGATSSWLSEIRNQINYQHAYDLWLPYRKTSEGVKCFSNGNFPKISQARLDISKVKNPVAAFINVALYVTNLSLSVSEFVAERSTKGGAFGQKWKRIENILRA